MKMHTGVQSSRVCRALVLLAVSAGRHATSAPPTDVMPSSEQTALVQKYCAVCHTDAAKNGGLSLQHYDATQADPQLAAMLLSKLRNGAMGAAGLGVPDSATQKAWVAATAVQAERAKDWTVIRTELPAKKATVVSASIIRDVAPRNGTDVPLYRLTLLCNVTTRSGHIQLTWSPEPQTDRSFSVSADGNAAIPHKLQGREERMGNGAALTSGLAAVLLGLPLPERTLTIADLFAGETVVFPIGELDAGARRQLAVCLGSGLHR